MTAAPANSVEFPVLLRWLLPLAIFLAPIPLGSNRPLFEALLMLTAGLGLLLWGKHLKRSGHGYLLGWAHLRQPAVCAGLALFWAIIQALPAPAFIAHPIWSKASALLETPLIGHISVDPWATGSSLLMLLTYLAFFALAFQLGRSALLARLFLAAFAISATAIAAYGLMAYGMDNTHILWLPKQAYFDSLTATFINRNAFAAMAGMGLLAGLALFAHNLALHSHYKKLILQFSACIVLLVALLLSNSRAGLASMGLGAFTLWLGLWTSRLLPRKHLLVAGLLGLGLSGFLFWLLGEQLLGRLDGLTFAHDERLDIWHITLQMIRDYPLTGQGLGTYDQLFTVYRTEDLWLRYTHAHNSYLELAAELGLPAALCWFAAFIFIGQILITGIITRRQQKIYPVFALAVLAQAATHALVDFSFQTPANAVWLAIILGLGCAQSFRSTEH